MAIAPTPIPAAPPVPNSSVEEPTFDAQYEAFNAYQADDLVPGMNALAANVYANAQAAESAAASAAVESDLAMGYRNAAQSSAAAALASQGAAATSAIAAEASNVQASKLNLGAKSSAPTVDNQGAALLTGATYYDTTLGKWRAWTGSAWADPANTSGAVSKSGDSMAGSLEFTGAGRRITGDMSNATIASQIAVQTSTVNNNTTFRAIPNGTGSVARFSASNASDPGNASEGSLVVNATDVRIESTLRGSGSYLPITSYVGGVKNTEQPVAGGFLVTAPAGAGYGTGAGGTVTQTGSKSDAVALNKPCGKITMHNASLAASTTVLFTFTNSVIGTGDIVNLQLDASSISNTGNYNVWAAAGSGSCIVAVRNISGGALAEAVQIRFSVTKGALA